MAKRFLMPLAALLGCIGAVYAAEDATWLKIVHTDGNDRYMATDGLVMTVADGMLLCTGPDGELSLPLESLESMEFTDINSGITTPLGIAADEPVDIYDASGLLVARCVPSHQVRAALDGKPGVYILKTTTQTYKLATK